MRVRHIFTFFQTCWIISVLSFVALLLPVSVAGADADTIPALPLQSPVIYDFDKFPVSGLSMTNPSVITTHYEYDPETGYYIRKEMIGDMVIGTPVYISLDDYLQYDLDNRLQQYWKERSTPQDFERRDGLIPEIYIGGEFFDRIFGGSTIDIRPSGSAELTFGVMSNYREDPALDEQRRRTTNFDFQQQIQLSVEANIGTKVSLAANYNTEATFDFENRMKLEYRGTEDEIVQLIEAGDVTLPLAGSLIRGTHGLFGFKTQLRFGNTTVTSIFSQQKTESSSITVAGGAQMTEFMIRADEYEANRHFFLGQYFRDNYDDGLSNLPTIMSNINITRIEVWVTNVGPATEDNRNIVAFADLGENEPYSDNIQGGSGNMPDNASNDLYDMMVNSPIRNISQVNSHLSGAGYVSGEDYENVENARRLRENEYSFNPKLGFISLNRTINPDQVLAVAFEYTLIGQEGVKKVGEFTNEVDAPNGLIVKLLKSTAVNTDHPLWDLMMKNVYSLNSFQISRDQFRLNVLYDSEELGVPVGYLDEGPEDVQGKPLIRVMGLDRLNTQLDPVPDGVFDFIDRAATQGGTIEANNGRIYFPVTEPFGDHLRNMLEDDSDLVEKYVFDELYRLTKNEAQQVPERNRWFLEGSFQSASGAEIPLNAMNVPQGSVVVTAGGVPLTENIDYTVDYTLGRVRIINDAILNAGTPINISLESSDLFNLQTKTLLGTHVDHRISDNFNVGATVMRLSERPLTQKVSYGDEPIANTIWGLNTTYSTESMFITRMLDRLPFYETNTPSRITFNGEFAHLIPGHSRHIGSAGTAYIDDFEGSKSAIDLKNVQRWQIASTPQHQIAPGMFPEGALHNDLAFRFNVARLAWYIIDPLFTRNSSLTPSHIRNDVEQRSNHFVREVLETEIWPNKESPTGIPSPIPVFNMAFFPNERGHYNYDALGSSYSSGMAQDGTLRDPNTRWGGVMRGLPMTDFEAANIEYIEFWMMDPFVYDETHSGGDLYFNLGDISEDVLRDGRKSFENGLPVSEEVVDVDTTAWGRVPTIPAVVHAFDNNPDSREFQDVGLDGLSTEDERSFFNENFLQLLADEYGTGSAAYQLAWADPSADNYQYYRGSDLDAEEASIIERYKRYNGLEGNSPTADQSPEAYPTSASNLPNTEDINQDGTLSETERYYQYRVSLRPEDMEVGQNYITNVVEASVRLANNEVETVRWYQFKIPLRDPNRQVIGNIQDFKSIRFIRMFYKDFNEPIITRFASLQLIRGEWRTYDRELTEPGEFVPGNNDDTSFEVFAVNIEENGQRFPIPYVLPPGIEREQDLGTTTMHRRNEQSLAMKVANLQDGDARAVYKTANLDVRQYHRLKMFAHAEAINENEALNDGDLTVFIRLGSDFTNNYYEYEVPLVVTPWLPRTFNPDVIWPEDNNFDVEFAKLQELKLLRNALSREEDSGVAINRPFSESDGNNRMTIMGNPTLSNVQVIMIGIRNPKNTPNTPEDDGLPKSAEVWVNELRLYDFNDEGGWAANARVNATLADLGNIAVAGFISTPGFGGIEQSVSERSQEEVISYDIATNLELGRLLPESFGMRIPMHFSLSESISNPLYNPLNPDILFEDDLASYETKAERDSIRRLAQDVVRRKNINFTNVSLQGFGSQNRIYSIDNFDFTYAYTEMFARNVNIEYDRRETWRGAINYNYNTSPRNVTPFSNVSLFQNDLLRLLREFNFYYFPRSVSFRTSMDRGYAESLMRAKSAGIVLLEPNYVKSFDWDRRYDIRWDLTRALRLEFNATTQARIDELPGSIYEDDDEHTLLEKKDFVRENILDLGRPIRYNHRLNLTYNIPLNRLPGLDWVNANAGYAADFDWIAAHRSAIELGNTIENSQTLRLNTNANLVNLYNKVGFLQRINQQSSGGRGGQQQGRGPQPPRQQQQEEEEDDDDGPGIARIIFETTARMLMSVRNLSINYTETSGIHMPGFTPDVSILGQDWDLMAPGFGFIFGSQADIRPQAAREGWITENPMLNVQYSEARNKNLTVRSQVEPIRNMRIEVTAQRNHSRTHTEYFKADSLGNFDSFNPLQRGSFTISFLAIRTTFESVDSRLYTSENFDNFKEYRLTIANRLAQLNPNWSGEVNDETGFPEGYGPTSQDVLIPAFLAAYAGTDPENAKLDPFLRIPMPNWRLTYDGLGRIPALQQWVQSVTIGHGYRSTFTMANFQSHSGYVEVDGYPSTYFGGGGGSSDFDVEETLRRDFVPELEISQVTINEQFNPLINIDITWQNNLMTRTEYRRSRDMGLSFSNNQITDHSSREIIVGAGYRFQNLAFNITQGGSRQRVESDLVLRLDLSIRENKTILRKLLEESDVISSGQQNIAMNFSAEYQLSPRVNFRLFFDRSVNNPFVSNQFPNTNTHGGFSLRFILI